jgi:uncharacterized membrane protein YhaH (DUF805 family)
MEKTAKPTVAGIFMIVSGALGIIGAILTMIGIGFYTSLMGDMSGYGNAAIVGGVMMFWGIIGIIISLFSVVSGAYCLKRRLWGLALAGSILSVFQVFFLGIPALILVAVSKQEFE